MTMRRLLFWLVSFCFLFSALCGVVYGAEWTSIDDLGIDPWGDLEAIQALPTPSPEVGQDLEQVENLTIYDVGDDTATAPYALDVSGYLWPRTGDGRTLIRVQGLPSISNVIDSQTFDLHTGFNVIGSANDDGSYFRTSIKIFSGSSYQVLAYVNYPASSNSKIYLSGQFSAYPMIKYTSNAGSEVRVTVDTSYLRCKLLVNGSPVGKWVAGDRLSLSDYEIDLSQTGNIYSVGILVEALDDAISSGATTDRYGNRQPIHFGIYVSDSLSISADVKVPGQDNDDQNHEETKGLLQTIINGITDLFTAITHLPVQIANAIKDMLSSLFVPTQAQLTTLKTNFQHLLETKFGFIYQAFQMLDTAWQELVDGWKGHGDYKFIFPGITVPVNGETFVICEPIELDTNNELFSVLRGAAGTIVSFMCVLGSIHSFETMFIAIVSGKNYFDYIRAEAAMDAEEGSD